MKNSPVISINSARLSTWINKFAEFGATPKGGVTRLALSDADKKARDFFVHLAKEAGCRIQVDAIGNIFARRLGRNPQLKSLLTGSHGDSQPQGGRFDGIYGVLAGLEVLYSLNDHQIQTEHSLDVVMWTNEEGARFSPALIGSDVFIGAKPLSEALACTDVDGKNMGDELQRIGYAGRDVLDASAIHAVLELHIEQGPVLENNRQLIGVVTGALGQKWYEVRLNGMAAHAGTTPMDARKDALLGFARAALAVNAIGLNHSPDGRATIGKVKVLPNSPNVVPAEVAFSVEFRHSSTDALEHMDQQLRTALNDIGAELKLDHQIKQTLSFAPIYFSSVCINAVRNSVRALNFAHQDIVSGAGHDACKLHTIAPTAMIFIPCIGGISHNELEDITQEWSAAGAQVLLHSLLALDKEVF